MSLAEYVVGSAISGGAVLAAAIYLFQASFTRLLDKRMEVFRQQLQVDMKAKELTLKSHIEFKESKRPAIPS